MYLLVPGGVNTLPFLHARVAVKYLPLLPAPVDISTKKAIATCDCEGVTEGVLLKDIEGVCEGVLLGVCEGVLVTVGAGVFEGIVEQSTTS